MAQTEIHLKELFYPLSKQPAELIAACKDREGFLILEAASYTVRARFTEKETAALALKFNPPSP